MGRFNNNIISTEWFTSSKMEYYDSRFKYYAGEKRKPLLKTLNVNYKKKATRRMHTIDWTSLESNVDTVAYPFDLGLSFASSMAQPGLSGLHLKYEEVSEATKGYKKLVGLFYEKTAAYLESTKLESNDGWIISNACSHGKSFKSVLTKDITPFLKKETAHSIALSQKIYAVCNERLRERQFAGRHIKIETFQPFNKDLNFFPDLLKEKLAHLERARDLSVELSCEYHSGKRRELKRLELILNSETTFIKHVLITRCFTQDRVIAVLLNTISLLRKKIKLLSKLLSALLSRLNRFTRIDMRRRLRSIIRFLFKNMDDTDSFQMINLNNNHLKLQNHIIHVKTRNNCPAPGNLQRREPWTYQRAA